VIEIQNIKNKKLICLDIDDCILPWSKVKIENGKLKIENNTKEERLNELRKNVNIIKKFCNKNNYEVFIISSWSPIIKNDLTLLSDDKELNEYWNIIKELPIIGKDPFKDRILAMEVLIDNNNKIICIDDFDLEHYFQYTNNFKMLNVFCGLNLKKLYNFYWHSFQFLL